MGVSGPSVPDLLEFAPNDEMLPPAMIKCHHEQALSDLYIGVEQGGGCNHFTFGNNYRCGLDYWAIRGENTCCLRTCR